MWKITIDKADSVFSQYIRKRDKECVRCHSKVQFSTNGLPITHQCSHFYGRRNEATRHDPDNCDTLCYGCHQKWGGDNHEDYRRFKIKQLGEKRFKELQIRAEVTYFKKDRKMALIISKELLKSLEKYDKTSTQTNAMRPNIRSITKFAR